MIISPLLISLPILVNYMIYLTQRNSSYGQATLQQLSLSYRSQPRPYLLPALQVSARMLTGHISHT